MPFAPATTVSIFELQKVHWPLKTEWLGRVYDPVQPGIDYQPGTGRYEWNQAPVLEPNYRKTVIFGLDFPQQIDRHIFWLEDRSGNRFFGFCLDHGAHAHQQFRFSRGMEDVDGNWMRSHQRESGAVVSQSV